MTLVQRIAGAAALGAAMPVGAGLFALSAQAAYTVTLMQAGNNVVATGSGTIDLTGLSFVLPFAQRGSIAPSAGLIVTGPASVTPIDLYTGFTGPTSFGSKGGTVTSSGSGDLAGVDGLDGNLYVPLHYVSGSFLSDTSTYDNQTLASLGVTPGTYTWTWGSGPSDDTFTLDIPTAQVPEPAGLAVLASGLIGLLAVRRKRSGHARKYVTLR